MLTVKIGCGFDPCRVVVFGFDYGENGCKFYSLLIIFIYWGGKMKEKPLKARIMKVKIKGTTPMIQDRLIEKQYGYGYL